MSASAAMMYAVQAAQGNLQPVMQILNNPQLHPDMFKLMFNATCALPDPGVEALRLYATHRLMNGTAIITALLGAFSGASLPSQKTVESVMDLFETKFASLIAVHFLTVALSAGCKAGVDLALPYIALEHLCEFHCSATYASLRLSPLYERVLEFMTDLAHDLEDDDHISDHINTSTLEQLATLGQQ